MTTTPPAAASPAAPSAAAEDHRTLVVEIWSDLACPWCYLGRRRLESALAAFEHRDHVRTVWRSFELAPDAPPAPGLPEAEALARSKGLDVAQVHQLFEHVTRVAAEDGLHLDFGSTLSANTYDAHRLVHLAARAGGEELAGRTIDALYGAHFSQGLDLGLPETLQQLAADVGFADHGLAPDAVRAALAGDDGGAQVRSDEAEARALGVQGVPFVVVDRRLAVSGAQPVEVFTQLLEQAWRDATSSDVGARPAPATDGDGCAV